MIDYEGVACRLKKYRNKAGMSQNDMGELFGIGQYYGNIERCSERPSMAILIRIAEKIKVDVDWLVEGKGEEPVPALRPAPATTPVKDLVELPDLPPKPAIHPPKDGVHYKKSLIEITHDGLTVDLEIDFQAKACILKWEGTQILLKKGDALFHAVRIAEKELNNQ